MAITTAAQLKAAIAVGPVYRFNGTTANLPDTQFTPPPWQVHKSLSAPGAWATLPAYTAGSGYTVSNVTAGCGGGIRNAVTQHYLARVEGIGASGYNAGSTSGVTGSPISVLLVDILWWCRSMPATAGGVTNTVTTPGALPARITDDGLGCELWHCCEDTVNTGTASSVYTNYIDSAGSAQVTSTMTWLNSVSDSEDNVWRYPLANNLGVKQITSSVFANTSGSSGTYALLIVKPIAQFQLDTARTVVDAATLGLPAVLDGAFLAPFTSSMSTVSNIRQCAFTATFADG